MPDHLSRHDLLPHRLELKAMYSVVRGATGQTTRTAEFTSILLSRPAAVAVPSPVQ